MTTPTATPLSAAPLGQRPTLRMQDGDIILEDGALGTGTQLAPSPFQSNNHNNPLEQQHHRSGGDNATTNLGKSPATPPLPPGVTAGVTGDVNNPLNQPMITLHSSQLTLNSLTPQISRPPTFGGSAGPTATPEPARSAGGGVGSFRLHFDVVESVRGAKYRTTELTASNVQQLTKQQYGGESSKASTTERLWRWLADAGPPYEVHPSIGVSSKPPIHRTNGTTGSKLFSCFKCITS